MNAKSADTVAPTMMHANATNGLNNTIALKDMNEVEKPTRPKIMYSKVNIIGAHGPMDCIRF